MIFHGLGMAAARCHLRAVMIVAIGDDAGLMVFDEAHPVQKYCEVIDVENGTYEFWNDQAQAYNLPSCAAESCGPRRSIWKLPEIRT